MRTRRGFSPFRCTGLTATQTARDTTEVVAGRSADASVTEHTADDCCRCAVEPVSADAVPDAVVQHLKPPRSRIAAAVQTDLDLAAALLDTRDGDGVVAVRAVVNAPAAV